MVLHTKPVTTRKGGSSVLKIWATVLKLPGGTGDRAMSGFGFGLVQELEYGFIRDFGPGYGNELRVGYNLGLGRGWVAFTSTI